MAENALPTGLPYPTPTRLALADDIAAGCLTGAITARCAELAAAGLVHVDVRLTPDGMAWVTRARTSEPGPAATSPVAGPDPDAVMVMGALLASPKADEPGMLLLAAQAYEALKSSRERESGHSTEPGPPPNVAWPVSGEPHDPGSYCEVCRGYRDDPHDCPPGHSTEDGA